MHAEAGTVRTARLDRHAGASRGPAPMPSPYPEIHDTAARQDGIVKILTGLIFVVFSIGLAAMGVLAVHALLKNHEFKLWAFIIGVPGVLLALLGLVLIAWGAAKLLSGRGQG
jgi:hypothetical protein